MLFGKKKLSVEELADMYKSLSDEDKAKFTESVKVPEEPKAEEPVQESEPEEKTEEQPEEKSEEKLEEKSEEPESTEEAVETPAEEGVESEGMEENSEEDAQYESNKVFEGFEARLKAIETALFSQKEVEKPADVGVSGFGKSAIGDETTRDTRVTDTIKKLGGRA